MFEEIIKSYKEAWLYTNTFTNFEGEPVQIKSVVLVRYGIDFHHVFNTWQQSSRHNYSTPERISIEAAMTLPNLPDRLTLKGRVELIGDTAQYITHEYNLEYL